MKYAVESRKKTIRNTDPLGRCYDGCFLSSVEEWTKWEEICRYTLRETAEDSMATFQKINPRDEYRIRSE